MGTVVMLGYESDLGGGVGL